MMKYHDTEWGVPVFHDRKIFEFLVLEGMQAGLSWQVVLNKRENYRKAFHNFDPRKVARHTTKQIEAHLKNPGIIRNRSKIRAAINNAKRFIEIQKEFGSFAKYIWQFVGRKPIQHRIRSHRDYRARDEISDALAKDLKMRGFKFVGSTIVYAHMQATGMVNDHMMSCFRWHEVGKLTRKL